MMTEKKWQKVGTWLGAVFLWVVWVAVVQAFCWAFFSVLDLRSLIGVSVLSGLILLWMVKISGTVVRSQKAILALTLRGAFIEGSGPALARALGAKPDPVDPNLN